MSRGFFAQNGRKALPGDLVFMRPPRELAQKYIDGGFGGLIEFAKYLQQNALENAARICEQLSVEFPYDQGLATAARTIREAKPT